MEFLLDPGIWVSLLTLIILEIVLGIDNLVFIAILAEMKHGQHCCKSGQLPKPRMHGLTIRSK
jgi:hypothetical protein